MRAEMYPEKRRDTLIIVNVSGMLSKSSVNHRKGTRELHVLFRKEVHERQLRTWHVKSRYGISRSNFDFSLKVPILADSFNGKEREFQYLGAMFFIDLLSEWLTKKLLLAPLVE